jgi:hypothetical protein
MSVDGKWNLNMETPRGTQPVTLELKSNGSELSGTWSGQRGSQEFSGGKVEGENLEWTVNMSGPMGAMALVFKAKVDGDNLSGDVQLGNFGSGKLSGSRA